METVLVLEDDNIARRVICATLRLKHYNVLGSATASRALEIGRRRLTHLDLLVADVLLPDKSGVQAAVELFEERPEIAVLFISGTPLEGWLSQDLLTLQVLPRKAWEFLSKPFAASVLEHHVRKLLERALVASSHSAPLSARAVGSGEAYYSSAPAAPKSSRGANPVNRSTLAHLLRQEASGDAMTVPGLFEKEAGFQGASSSCQNIPDFGLCAERIELTETLLRAIHELTEIHSQQIRAVIERDPDFCRFDVLVHMAAERKDEAKYALVRHIESHHCEED
jgi:two-component system, cell cycle response regulator CpdR